MVYAYSLFISQYCMLMFNIATQVILYVYIYLSDCRLMEPVIFT